MEMTCYPEHGLYAGSGVYSLMRVDFVSAGQLLLWEINPYAPEMEINIRFVHLFSLCSMP